MPTDASFYAVSMVSAKYHPTYDVESVIITIHKYHNIEVLLPFDDKSVVVNPILHRMYQRYGYYEIANSIKSDFGYLAVPFKLPTTYIVQNSTKSRQVLAVYDTFDYEGESEKGFSERYMMGGFIYNKTDDLFFGFNRTYDKHTNGTRTGMVVSSSFLSGR